MIPHRSTKISEQISHDQIVFSSASTYPPQMLAKHGLRITVNTNSSKTQFVGNPNSPIYPDIILWKPDYEGAKNGTVILVESIETESTIDQNIWAWKILLSYGIRFNLVVPKDQVDRVLKIVKENKLTGLNIQTYSYDNNSQAYKFTMAK